MNKKTSIWIGGTAAALALIVGGAIVPAQAGTMTDVSSTYTATPAPAVVDPTATPTPDAVDPTATPTPEAIDPTATPAPDGDSDDATPTAAPVTPPVVDPADVADAPKDNHGYEVSTAAHARNAVRHAAHDVVKAAKRAEHSSKSHSKGAERSSHGH